MFSKLTLLKSLCNFLYWNMLFSTVAAALEALSLSGLDENRKKCVINVKIIQLHINISVLVGRLSLLPAVVVAFDANQLG